jgi:hypothetical protein
VFVVEAFRALQLDQEHIFDEDVWRVFSHALALVQYREFRLSDRIHPLELQFAEQSPLVDFFEKADPSVFETSITAPITASVNVLISAFICIHLRLIWVSIGRIEARLY